MIFVAHFGYVSKLVGLAFQLLAARAKPSIVVGNQILKVHEILHADLALDDFQLIF